LLKVALNTINLNHHSSSLREKFEDTKDVIRSRVEEGRTIQWPKEKGLKDKQWLTKHYTKNYRD